MASGNGATHGAAEIDRIYAAQTRNRAAVAASTAAERIRKLKRFERVMLARRPEIRAAMCEDYEKPAAEVDLAEIYPVTGEARYAIRHLRSWMKPKRVGTRLALFGSRSKIVHEPKGVVAIISPWNFPFNLTLGPLVSAVAAGNCAMLKPSELTPASSACIRRIVADVFPEDEVAVIEGDAEIATSLLQKRFDHIFFTGSTRVARFVMKAAAEHLTPVTLELGGKSPAIVDVSANLREAARKIAWGKHVNSGQACVAPDYALVHESVAEEFASLLGESIASFGERSRAIMVNESHGSRVKSLIDEAVAGGAEIVAGGESHGRRIASTVLSGVPADGPVMREEIFGPVLPLLTWRTDDELFAELDRHGDPLVLYLFARDDSRVKAILRRTRSGAAVVNQTLAHFYQLQLPFGGVGDSGHGRAHGFHGFATFSNIRGVFEHRLPINVLDLIYPPYGGWLKRRVIDALVRWL